MRTGRDGAAAAVAAAALTPVGGGPLIEVCPPRRGEAELLRGWRVWCVAALLGAAGGAAVAVCRAASIRWTRFGRRC